MQKLVRSNNSLKRTVQSLRDWSCRLAHALGVTGNTLPLGRNMKIRMTLFIAAAATLAGCAFPKLPISEGERNSGFTYIPLDPLGVAVYPGVGCDAKRISRDAFILRDDLRYADLLRSLPDNAVRIAVKEYDNKNTLSYAGSSLGVEGKRYQVILDYINVDSSNIRFYILAKTIEENKTRKTSVVDVVRIYDEEGLAAIPRDASQEDISRLRGNIVIPVYVGVGLRLTADLQVLRGSLNLSSLGAIAAGVEAGKASGSLVVQTLGVAGKQVSTSLPLPSELNQTTVQNAILSLGSIKAIMFDTENTVLTPRVTGMYLPIQNGNEELVNRIVSELARDAIPWKRPCEIRAKTN